MPFSPPVVLFHKKTVCVLLAQVCLCLLITAQDFDRRIDSLKKVANNAVNDENYINTCFKIADDFMEINGYDSAQLWLNRIAERLPLRKPSPDNYYLSSRQAEVYYYNGLQRLGLQESERSLSIAQALNDSLLLADAYNFLGLFYINLDSSRKAIPYFQKGILYARQPPYPARYLSLTKPHHLYGNMAEAYEKLHQYDSSIYLSHISLQLATEIGWKRGVAIAHNNLGKVFLETNRPDSALYHYELSRQTALASEDFDVELLDYGGIAKAEDLRHRPDKAMAWLREGFALIKQKPSVNNLFAGYFLDDAIELYRKYGEQQLLSDALQMKADLLEQLMNDNNRQVNVILNAGLQNETRLLGLQVKEIQQRNEIVSTRLYLLLSLLVLVIAAFLLYRYKSRQKLQIARLQNKISQDLHDDIGSSLSSLQVYSSVATQVMDAQPEKAKEMLRRITNESAALMDNIGDIVWSMKTEKEQAINLDSRIKNFISDVLGAANIHYTITIEEGIDGLVKNMTARKNVLMIIKEAVNNTLRHARARQVSVSVKKLAGRLLIQVADNGKGFDSALTEKGEGLGNMQKRTEELNGIFELSTSPGKGTIISALLPLTNISDTA